MTLLTSLTELIKLAEEATDGPWFASIQGHVYDDDEELFNAHYGRDSAFIAAARNLLDRHAEELIKAVELWETPRMGDETP